MIVARAMKAIRYVRSIMLSLMSFAIAVTFAHIGLAANVHEVTRGVAIDGTIVKGDYAKFESILTARATANNPVKAVWLSSGGGDVQTALAIGRLIRKNWIMTTTNGTFVRGHVVCFDEDGKIKSKNRTASCSCDSACFLIWAAGVERISSGYVVGLHRPHFGDLPADKPPDPSANAAYKGIIVDVRDYLKEMNIPDQFFDLMMGKSSKEIYQLSEEDVTSMKYSPLAEEAIIKSCGEIAEKNLILLKAASDYSDAVLGMAKDPSFDLDKLLNEKFEKLVACNGNVVFSAQAKLQSH